MSLFTVTATVASKTTDLVYASYSSTTTPTGEPEIYRVFPYYTYKPNLGAGALFAALFGITFVLLCVRIGLGCKNRNQVERQLGLAEFDKEARQGPIEAGFTPATPCTNTRLVTKFIPLLIGVLTECGGYIARIVSRSDLFALGPYVAQTVMLLVAAAFMAATIYMIFGRLMILMNATKVSFVPIRFNTAIFVGADVLSILLQGAGGGILGTSDDKKLGSDIVIGGLAVQVFAFGLFVITELRFLFLADKVSPLTSQISRQWRILNYNLFVCSLLILVRSIVRLVEFAQGWGGYLMDHEWCIYVFDAVPMFWVSILFFITFSKGNLFRVEFECTSMLQSRRRTGSIASA
ncbi:RTA1 domain-containing protein LALA0_S10e00672g [Lachancea lanzarotensis]|uniref:LALA0S10e00672g1_1 n=1 Tax=Lachancea lanzarotensis TaxID=1245769 RepID=A0A0C7NCH8_9SACH|nr:uncharacterized protein LALA0_S10e00672g [Lachancea lanzarotensis]CEP64032.1 LALA0S10e00672g1_1 [Lachancea lanzarotensis]